MDFRQELEERLRILEEGNLISERVSHYTAKVIDAVLSEKSDVDEEKMSIFVTHLAMAGQRMLEGKEEEPIDENVFRMMKEEAVFEKAEAFVESELFSAEIPFSALEKEYLKVHLCNLWIEEL